jgi:hypothetical protein
MTAVQGIEQAQVQLRRGDRVRLRSRAEIEATLDAEGRTEMLPFMAEMLPLAGRELTVQARADKTCDTINMEGVTRKMSGTVHLEGARCDGSRHGGCQAYCLLFFKESWLEPVPPLEGGLAEAEPAGLEEAGELADRLDDFATAGPDVYRCQATELLHASSPLAGRSHYVDDVRTRNVPLGRALKAAAYAIANLYQRLSRKVLPSALQYAHGEKLPAVRGRVVDGQWPAEPPLDLQPGDLVEVRSKAEIEATLDASQKNRGLWFDEEMLVHCGRRGRVLHRVERLIDEKSGRMLKVKKDLIVVEGMVGCAGVHHSLCPRSFIAMWRESWLRRVP